MALDKEMRVRIEDLKAKASYSLGLCLAEFSKRLESTISFEQSTS